MHEMALTESIVEIAVETARREGAGRVRRVFVEIGRAEPRRAGGAAVLLRRRFGRDDRRRRDARDRPHARRRLVHGLRQDRAARGAVRPLSRLRRLPCPDDGRRRDAGAGDRGRLSRRRRSDLRHRCGRRRHDRPRGLRGDRSRRSASRLAFALRRRSPTVRGLRAILPGRENSARRLDRQNARRAADGRPRERLVPDRFRTSFSAVDAKSYGVAEGAAVELGSPFCGSPKRVFRAGDMRAYRAPAGGQVGRIGTDILDGLSVVFSYGGQTPAMTVHAGGLDPAALAAAGLRRDRPPRLLRREHIALQAQLDRRPGDRHRDRTRGGPGATRHRLRRRPPAGDRPGQRGAAGGPSRAGRGDDSGRRQHVQLRREPALIRDGGSSGRRWR